MSHCGTIMIVVMLTVKELIWDDWNLAHIQKHKVSQQEILEVFKDYYRIKESYRKRLLIVGKTKSKRILVIILSPEDRNLRAYNPGVYYVITAFEIKEFYEE